MPYKLNDEDLQTIKRLIGESYNYEAVYLYGSYARGAAHANSDVDICIKMSEGAKITRYDLDLNAALTTAIGIDCHAVFCTKINGWCELLI